MPTHFHKSFDRFLSEMLLMERLSPEQLIKLLGKEGANRILKNRDTKTKKKKSTKTKKTTTKSKKKQTTHQKSQAQRENIGRKTANRIFDNADNEIGAPALGSSTGVVLHGQLHRMTGTINDVKSRIADNLEKKQQPEKSIDKAEKNIERPTPSPFRR